MRQNRTVQIGLSVHQSSSIIYEKQKEMISLWNTIIDKRHCDLLILRKLEKISIYFVFSSVSQLSVDGFWCCLFLIIVKKDGEYMAFIYINDCLDV